MEALKPTNAKGKILFKHGWEIKIEKIGLKLLSIIVIIIIIASIITNSLIILNFYLIFFIIIVIGTFILYHHYLKIEDLFGVYQNGFSIPTNYLFPLYKKRPKVTFIPFSDIKAIKKPKYTPSIWLETKNGKKYFQDLNRSEFEELKNILLKLNLNGELKL